MSIKKRLVDLETQLQQKHQTMPEGLSPREQYLFLINNAGNLTRKLSVINTLTPAQAYSVMAGGKV